jgi:D-beta-D-heptose 7-phosphate kinase/D-beta-D-heptose 1-phosphate adenosyltransferase
VGHVRYLEKAKSLGEILVVAVNSDRSASALKGPSRPINPEQHRAEVIAALGCVDYVTLFDECDPYHIISLLKPDVLVKGGDWTRETTVGRDIVEQQGGRVVIIPYTAGHSTTALIDQILTRSGAGLKKNSQEQ